MSGQLPYNEKVMDHFTNPRNVGEIPDASGVGTVGNPICGDVMKMFLKIENDTIVDVKFKTFGCGAAVATSSMVTEMVKGKTIAEALKVSNKAVAEALGGLPPVKMHCSVLAAEALRATLADYYTRQGEIEKAAELVKDDVVPPVEAQEAQPELRWNDFGRMVRALNSAYPDVEPLDLTMTKLFKMVLQLPGFADHPDAVGEEQLEKLQMAWHEVRAS